MTTNLYLDLIVKAESKPIYIYVRGLGNKKTIKIHTGEYIKSAHWNPQKQRVKSSVIGSLEMNQKLESIIQRVHKKHSELTTGSTPSFETLKRELTDLFVMPQEKLTLLECYSKYIESIQKTASKSHLARHKVVQGKLLSFLQTRKQVGLSFEVITPEFYDEFCYFLTTTEKLIDHVALRYFRYLRMFVKDSWKKGYHQTMFPYDCPINDEKPQQVTLTVQEIQRIKALDLSGNKRLYNVRNIMLLQLLTGLRYGDLIRLNASNFNMEEGFITITTSKTNAQPTIPITEEITLLLLDYPDFKINFISHQKQSVYLKELCKTAGIDNPVTLTRRRNGKLESTTKPKYEWIGTHTLRRSKITILDSMGFSISEIMQHTGHKKQEQVLQYIHHERNRIAEKLNDIKLYY